VTGLQRAAGSGDGAGAPYTSIDPLCDLRDTRRSASAQGRAYLPQPKLFSSAIGVVDSPAVIQRRGDRPRRRARLQRARQSPRAHPLRASAE
jgi:hypothetical protein